MKKLSTNANANLNKAKIKKNNELFTHIEDIEKEILGTDRYRDYFFAKSVLCNCNDTEESGFWRFFKSHFNDLDLRKLTAVSYVPEGRATVITYNGEYIDRYKLNGDGSFDSPECVQLLDESDVACSNPPFSLFIPYILLLTEHHKDFLLVGNINEMVCRDIFPMFQAGDIWYGTHTIRKFTGPDGEKKFGNVGWYTNIGNKPEAKKIPMVQSYIWCDNRDEMYPKYDGYDAIDVSRVINLPYDYYGEMGVPLSYLTVHNPDQFELVGVDRYTIPKEFQVGGRAAVNGKGKFPRVLIKRIKN